jgi:hypothetical protein
MNNDTASSPDVQFFFNPNPQHNREQQREALLAFLKDARNDEFAIRAAAHNEYYRGDLLTERELADALGIRTSAFVLYLGPTDVFAVCPTCGKHHLAQIFTRHEARVLLASDRDRRAADIECDACEQVTALRTMPYRDYLKTAHWRDVRNRALDRAARRCQLCNSPDHLEVHHRTYERRGCERDDDLTVLCARCHSKFHEE